MSHSGYMMDRAALFSKQARTDAFDSSQWERDRGRDLQEVGQFVKRISREVSVLPDTVIVKGGRTNRKQALEQARKSLKVRKRVKVKDSAGNTVKTEIKVFTREEVKAIASEARKRKALESKGLQATGVNERSQIALANRAKENFVEV